jgi:hypothetical protein
MEKEASFPSPDESAIHDKVTKKRERGLALPLSRARVCVRVCGRCRFVLLLKTTIVNSLNVLLNNLLQHEKMAKPKLVVVVVSLTHFVFIDFRHRVEDGHETDEAHRHNENNHRGDFQPRRIVRVKLEDGVARAAASRGDVGPRPGAWSFA